MSIPLIQQYRIGKYLLRQKLSGRKRYPLVLMLEPLFQCNLACAGCGKIDYEKDILQRRMSVSDALAAVDDCGAPVVSIPGGEPLIHKELPQIVAGIVARKKFVYLCTNAILVPKHIDEYQPSPYLTFSIHLDGLQRQHDASVCQEGVFDKAVAAIRLLRERNFPRDHQLHAVRQGGSGRGGGVFRLRDDTRRGSDHGVARLSLRARAASRCVSWAGSRARRLFREIFTRGRAAGRNWLFNHSALYLDFLAGNQSYQCTPWSNPTYNVFGWQRPCYLMSDEGYAPSFRSLMEDTPWDRYGVGRDPRCDNCMAHCGFEGTAVNDLLRHPLKALRVALSWTAPHRSDGTRAAVSVRGAARRAAMP